MMKTLLNWFRDWVNKRRGGNTGVSDSLPWYLNRTLGEAERHAVEDGLAADPQARADLEEWQLLQHLVAGQFHKVPSPSVHRALLNRVSAPPTQTAAWKPSPVLGALVFTLTALVLLWVTIRPGVLLEWSVEGSGLAAYRIYRAEEGSAEFTLLEEIPAETGARSYHYVDTLLLPGERYVYLVQGLGEEGATAFSQAVTGGSHQALPGQAAVLLVSLLFGLGGAWIWQTTIARGAPARRWVGG